MYKTSIDVTFVNVVICHKTLEESKNSKNKMLYFRYLLRLRRGLINYKKIDLCVGFVKVYRYFFLLWYVEGNVYLKHVRGILH